MTGQALPNTAPSKKNKQPWLKLIELLEAMIPSQLFTSAGLFIIALLYTLYFGREILLPIAIALLLYFLLLPIITFLRMLYIPPQLGAALILLILLLIICYGFYSLSIPIEDWISRGPAIFNEVESRLDKLASFMAKPFNFFSAIKNQFEAFAKISNQGNIQVVEFNPFYFMGIFSNTWTFFAGLGETFILLYFLLASEDFLLRKIVKSRPSLKQKKETVKIIDQTARQICVYLFARTIINVALAMVISILMYFCGLPNPILWGVMAGILEFIPYLGILFGTLIIILVSILSFDSISYIISVPVVFFTVIAIEGNFIAPYVLGRSLTLNPTAVFLSVIFWGWIWGIAGALIAIPLVVTFKIILDNVYESSLMSELLGE